MDLHHLVSKNQSIKIVPSTEESLRSIGLNVELDTNTLLWLGQLKTTWRTWKKSVAVENHIEQFFHTKPDPHRLALVFVIKCEEIKDCKPKTLPYFIIETLQKWSFAKQVSPPEILKLPAFHIAKLQRNQSFLNLMVKTYQVSTIKDQILPAVRDMIKSDNCKQASQIVISMELFEDVPVEALLFPLVLQDKPNMIDDYLSECPSQIKPFLLFLDKLLDKKFNLREYVQNYLEEHNICHIKYEKLHSKPLGKLVARLCNKYNVPIETCKNLSKNRTMGGLRYLIYQKYVENNVSISVWDDLVKDSLKVNVESGHEFVDMLVEYDKNEALKWAKHLDIPEINLPLALKDLCIEEAPTNVETWDTDDSNIPQACYKLALTDEQIVIVDTPEKFYDSINSLKNQSVVGIDCEWKPSFGATQSQVALIQIATEDKVFLIDAILLNKQEYSSFWYNFYKSLLENAEIIKLGFGVEQDMRELKASVIGLTNIKLKGEGLLDVFLLWKSLLSVGLNFPYESETGGNSLSSLVQSCFGLPLEKSEQCSNWELRPLRRTQVQYAALDAHVLIQIYAFLQKKCNEQGINFEEICNDLMIERKKKLNPKKVKNVEKCQPVVNSKTVRVNKINFLVEHKLSNMMIYLRYCGIDTTVMSSVMLWCDIINLAISDDRCIILSKLKCTPNANYPQSSILDIGIDPCIEHQLQKIFVRFCIDIRQEDLMTVCIHCNSKDLTKLSPEQVVKICEDYKTSMASSQYKDQKRCEDDDDDNYDNFLSDSDCDEDLYQASFSNNALQNKSCVTSKGIPIEITNIEKLVVSPCSGILCEACGRLFWKEDDLIKTVNETVFKLTKLKLW